jgi:hypothetical protein
LCNNQLGDYLRKSKKQIFLNNICLTSILQKPLVKNEGRMNSNERCSNLYDADFGRD